MNQEIIPFEIEEQSENTDELLVVTLQEFDFDDWVIYLQELFYDLNPSPSLRLISTELHEQLFWVYNVFDEIDKKTRLLFTKSVLHILRNIHPKENEMSLVHEIIYFINSVRPIESRGLLELIIRDESFVDLYFGSDNIHLLLVKSYFFIEDNEKPYIEEYVNTLLNVDQPYSLYIITYYYAYLGYEKKALNYFRFFLTSQEWTANPVLCREIYHALKDCFPKYISLKKFVEILIENDINFDQINNYLIKFINEFIEYLKSKNVNEVMTLIIEDILNGELNNIYEIEKSDLYQIDDDLKPLIFEFKARQVKEKEETEKDLIITNTTDINEIAEKVIRDDLFLTAGTY